MKLTSLATLTALVVRHVYASPAGDVLTPTGVPATSGPLSTLSFDTTAIPSTLSALSSLISSESSAITPVTSYARSAPTSSVNVTIPTTASPSVSAVTTSVTPTNTSGARRSRDVRPGVVAGIVVGAAVAALV